MPASVDVAARNIGERAVGVEAERAHAVVHRAGHEDICNAAHDRRRHGARTVQLERAAPSVTLETSVSAPLAATENTLTASLAMLVTMR